MMPPSLILQQLHKVTLPPLPSLCFVTEVPNQLHGEIMTRLRSSIVSAPSNKELLPAARLTDQGWCVWHASAAAAAGPADRADP